MKYAAGQYGGVSRLFFTESDDCVGDSPGQSAVKRARDFRLSAPSPPVVDDGQERRPEVKLASREWNGVRCCRAGAARQLLQPDCCLPLEGDLAGEPEKCGRSIEEPAGRSGGEAPRATR